MRRRAIACAVLAAPTTATGPASARPPTQIQARVALLPAIQPGRSIAGIWRMTRHDSKGIR